MDKPIRPKGKIVTGPAITTAATTFFTRKQLADRWRVSIMTLKRWEDAKMLRAFKFGRAVRYSSDDVEKFEQDAKV